MNAILILLRKIVKANRLGSTDDYLSHLSNLSLKDFRPEGATSSQYARLAQELFERYFKD